MTYIIRVLLTYINRKNTNAYKKIEQKTLQGLFDFEYHLTKKYRNKKTFICLISVQTNDHRLFLFRKTHT